MKKIKAVQIGIGHDHALGLWMTIDYLKDLFDFVGVVVVPEEEEYVRNQMQKATAEGREFVPYWATTPQLTLEEAFAVADLEAAFIETDMEHLTKYAHLALSRGLHVHVDKPGSASTEEYEAMLKTAQEKNCVYHMGYMYRYNPGVEKIRALMDAGKLGEVYAVEAQMSCPLSAQKRDYLNGYPGGMMYFLGCHIVDLVLRTMGIPETVTPFLVSTNKDDVNAPDYAMAVFRYPHGLAFIKTCGIEYGGIYRRQFVVAGTEGTVELKPFEAYALENPLPGGALKTHITEVYEDGYLDKRQMSETEEYHRYIGMLTAFAEMIRGLRKNPNTYEYEARLHRILLAACGETVDFRGKIDLH